MKLKLAVCAVALLAFRVEAGDVVIPAGTILYATTSKPISTAELAEGEPVLGAALLTEPFIVDGETVISAGTTIKLLVTELKKGRRARVGDEVTLTPMSLAAVDGSTINLTGTFSAKEATKVAKDVGFGIVTPWTLLKKGGAATIPDGRVFSVTIPAEVHVHVSEPK
jgi:hypothetical protein